MNGINEKQNRKKTIFILFQFPSGLHFHVQWTTSDQLYNSYGVHY